MFSWLRWLAALAVIACSFLSVKSGCAGRDYNPAVTPLPQANIAWMRRHDAKLAEVRRRIGQVDLVLIGDSITENYEHTDVKSFLDFAPVWNEVFTPHRALNLGFNGDRTGNVLWRLRHGELDGLAPANIVLLIGTNNLNPTRLRPHGDTSEEITAGTIAILNDLHQREPAALILVLSILPTNISAERTQRTSAINAQVRSRIMSLPYVQYLDVGSLFRNGERLRTELFYDQMLDPGQHPLHPTADGQRSMARAIAQALYGQERFSQSR